MLQNVVTRSLNAATRRMSTLSRQQVNGKLLTVNQAKNGKRLMSGHGPDISKLEATLYILIGGGGFAAFGMYQASSMRNRIEAFETGKVYPFKTFTDEEFLEFKEKFKEVNGGEE